MKAKKADNTQDVVQLEISTQTLEKLFNKGELCAAEIRCLNEQSKKQVRKLCLTSCTKRIEYSVVALEFCAHCG